MPTTTPSSRRVIVSLSFIPERTIAPALAQSIESEFSSRLPLQDLQWKSSSRSTVRTIDSLQLEFRPFKEAIEHMPKQQIPIALLDKPYLHIVFVACDVCLSITHFNLFSDLVCPLHVIAQDNDVYRSTVRQQIREWMDLLLAKRQYEWLIVHVTASKTGPKKFYQTKGSVYDKIRADFNTGKRDR